MFSDRGRRGGLSLPAASPSLPSHQERDEIQASSIEKTEKPDTEEKPSLSLPNRVVPSKERIAEITGRILVILYFVGFNINYRQDF